MRARDGRHFEVIDQFDGRGPQLPNAPWVKIPTDLMFDEDYGELSDRSRLLLLYLWLHAGLTHRHIFPAEGLWLFRALPVLEAVPEAADLEALARPRSRRGLDVGWIRWCDCRGGKWPPEQEGQDHGPAPMETAGTRTAESRPRPWMDPDEAPTPASDSPPSVHGAIATSDGGRAGSGGPQAPGTRQRPAAEIRNGESLGVDGGPTEAQNQTRHLVIEQSRGEYRAEESRAEQRREETAPGNEARALPAQRQEGESREGDPSTEQPTAKEPSRPEATEAAQAAKVITCDRPLPLPAVLPDLPLGTEGLCGETRHAGFDSKSGVRGQGRLSLLGQCLPAWLQGGGDMLREAWPREVYRRLKLPWPIDSALAARELGSFRGLYDEMVVLGVPADLRELIMQHDLRTAEKECQAKRNRNKRAVFCSLHNRRLAHYLGEIRGRAGELLAQSAPGVRK